MDNLTEVGVPVCELPAELPPIMPIDWIDDWEQRIARQDAFWEGEIIDRPVVNITFREENPEYPAPAEKQFSSHRDRWMNTEYSADNAAASSSNLLRT